MSNVYFISFLILFFVLVLIIAFLWKKLKDNSTEATDLRQQLEKMDKNVGDTLEKVSDKVSTRLDKITDQINFRLQENVKAINESKSFLTDRVENTEKTVRSVTAGLSKLQEASNSLMDTNKEILNFQRMLKVPKARGSFGEILLENLLFEHLPAEKFSMQYKFNSSGEIADAIIRLMDNKIVAIDSKFPLSNYEKTTLATDDKEKTSFYKLFLNDVKKHVKDISSKYISPRENTLDMAFMYIPIEGIYYEIVVKRQESTMEIWDFCVKNNVFPVSPNSFLSYLHTLLIGFRGMQIEKKAEEIINYISQIRRDFSKFSDDFTLLGSHLSHARNKYDDSQKRLESFTSRLGKIEQYEKKSLPLEIEREKIEV